MSEKPRTPPLERDTTAVPPGRFQGAYQAGGDAPWDIGRPQRAFVELEEAGQIRGSVLDAGCGTGENALYLAARGHETWGLDMVDAAIARAREKAEARGLNVHFDVGDALSLGALGRSFDTVIDAGLFHVFDDENRARYAASVGAVLPPGGVFHFLCFNEHTPGNQGPRRVTQAEIRATFQKGWRVREIRAHRFETTGGHGGAAQAWLASIEKL